MARRYRIQKIDPEFYFHYELRDRISANEFELIRRNLRKLARAAFAEKFSDIELSFEITLEPGSICGWIKAHPKVIGKILPLLNLMTKYDELRSGVDRLYDDIAWGLTVTKNAVEHYFDDEHGLVGRIHSERRCGAIAQLDKLIGQYQRQEISYSSHRCTQN